MAINERLIDTEVAAAGNGGAATGNQEEGLVLYLDANDVDSYDGDGSVWYDITDHEFTPAVDPSEHFNTVLYTGDSSSSKNITGVGFQPDLVWIKNRSASGGHWITDSIRGAGKGLMSQSTLAETTNLTELMSSFNSDGFTVGYSSNNTTNFSGYNYVAWCFKAGGAPTATNTATSGAMTANSVSIDDELQSSYTPTDATIYPKKISANTKLGFSTVLFAGTGNSNNKVPHGLGVPPELIIYKNIDEARGWVVGTDGIGWTNTMKLEDNSAAADRAYFDDIKPTSNVFEIYNGQANTANDLGSDFIAYCFASKRGVSKVGGYTGTGAAGNKVYTGFEPAFIMMKKASATSDWNMVDNKTSTDGRFNKYLRPNTTGAEVTPGTDINIHADGFSFNGGSFNSTNADWIYLAFAKNTKVADLTPSTDGTEIEKDLAIDSSKVYYTDTNYAIEEGGTVWRGNADNSAGSHEGEAYINNYFESGGTGKYYFEVESLGHTHGMIGFTDPTKYTGGQGLSGGLSKTSWRSYYFYGVSDIYLQTYNGSATYSSLSTGINTLGTVLAVAIDVATRKVWMGTVSSGTVTWFNSGNPSTGANPLMTIPTTWSFYQPLVADGSYSSGSARTGWHKLLRQETASTLPTGFTYMKGAIKNADLKLHIDIGSTSCYSGSGTTVNDLSSSSHTITTLAGVEEADFDDELGNFLSVKENSNEGLSIADHADFDHNNGATYEGWVYLDPSGTSEETFFFRGQSGTATGLRVYWHSSYGWFPRDFNSSGTEIIDQNNIKTGITGYGRGKWYHLALTLSSHSDATYKFYANGELIGSYTATTGSGQYSQSYPIQIGTYTGTTDLQGAIGQFRYYKTALDANQVMQNYLFTKNDYPNGYNGTISGATWNSGGYFSFDGSNDYVSTDLYYRRNNTVSLWVNFTSTSAIPLWGSKQSNYDWIYCNITDDQDSAHNDYIIDLWVRQSTSQYNYQRWNNVTLNSYGNWNFLTFRMEELTGTNFYMSVNGGAEQQSVNQLTSGTITTTPNGGINVGRTQSNGIWYYGNSKISKFKVHDKPLTSDEITALYNEGE